MGRSSRTVRFWILDFGLKDDKERNGMKARVGLSKRQMAIKMESKICLP
jgi:hypothetical protein